MTLKTGNYVLINIKRKSRWVDEAYRAFQGLNGFVEEIKADNGSNNILVKFAEPVLFNKTSHKCFHFLAEDLELYTERKVVPITESMNRRTSVMTWQSLLDLVEHHRWMITWDTSSKTDRGVIWTDSGDGMMGLFTMTNHGIKAHIDTRYINEWW